MVKIISRGTPPSEREYNVRCRVCSTVFEFQCKEAKQHSDQREGSYVSINCPVCSAYCTKSVSDFKKPCDSTRGHFGYLDR